MLSQRRDSLHPNIQGPINRRQARRPSSASLQGEYFHVYQTEFFEVDFGRDHPRAHVYWDMGRDVHARDQCKENQ